MGILRENGRGGLKCSQEYSSGSEQSWNTPREVRKDGMTAMRLGCTGYETKNTKIKHCLCPNRCELGLV